MGFFDSILGKKKRTLADIPTDELNRERIMMEQEQQKLEAESTRLFREEKTLRSEYANAESDLQKRSIARKIQDIRCQLAGLETRLTYCGKMLRSVNGFLAIKSNADFFKRMGVGPLIANMDIVEIERYIADTTVEGTLQQEKLAAMLQRLDGGAAMLQGIADDRELDALMEELDGAPTEAPAKQQTKQPVVATEKPEKKDKRNEEPLPE